MTEFVMENLDTTYDGFSKLERRQYIDNVIERKQRRVASEKLCNTSEEVNV